ncbi:hypothetical protein DACRYDRAFT_115217 [Dacryopinax primogenitus]|uniref:Zn(2)-C6 fungal-type domain-containing protein n=1 Tax=Dacryopinax primogenitus (strain DJM 731) TaxID=1858805 RepID=M5G102_DACPD|nr:uncharacterized protein DACRYDRAFT_115217 [Dacryopinax primogenitus]EJU03926.1 hypothetical protein DACRYDRAFT_115217 [Dacryopinax primogenitus]
MESRVSSAKSVRRTKACDACHRRKIRCDGEEGSPQPCSYCVKNSYECHFTFRPNKWPPSKTYVDGLERRVDYLERRVDTLKREVERLRQGGVGTSGYASSESDEFESVSPPNDDEDDQTAEQLREITERYEGLWLQPPTGMKASQEPRMYHGRASHIHILDQQIAALGQQSLDKVKAFRLHIRPEFQYLDPDLFDSHVDLNLAPPSWPEPDLAQILINAFFTRYNNVFPLLHKPTFMRQYADPALRQDRDWVAIAFGVFALASKYVEDPRVLPESGSWYSAGQKFWKEMRRVMSQLYAPPTLFRLQAIVLFTWYFSGTSLFPSAGWGIMALAIRYAQDAGMHLKKEWTKRAAAHPFEYEMRKRVFWVLYLMERTIGLEMDRSFCLQEDELDVDLPLELDDAGLDLLQQGEIDPPGFSLIIATFNARMRLLSFGSRKRTELRTIRRLTKEQDVIKRERYWLQSIRNKLDHFIANIPDNLKYDENEKDDDDFLSRALLKLQYHQIQFAMYRPFLSRSKRATHPSEPILDTCCQISRSVAHTLDVMRRRNLMMGRIHETALGGFVAGNVLLINMWENKNYDHMDDVEKCIQAIQAIEHRWQWPGRVHDVLCNLREIIRISIGNLAEPGKQEEIMPPDSNVSTVTAIQSQKNVLSSIESNASLAAVPFCPPAPTVTDDIISPTLQDFLTPPQTLDQLMFDDQIMSISDWAYPTDVQTPVDSEFADWLNSMIFSVPLPGSDPNTSTTFFNTEVGVHPS